MADLKNGLYIRETGSIAISAFDKMPGSYTINGAYRQVLGVRQGKDPDTVIFTVSMDPAVEETHQKNVAEFPKKKAEYEAEEAKQKAEGKKPSCLRAPEEPVMGAPILVMKVGDKTPAVTYYSELRYLGQIKDLVFFRPKAKNMSGMFGGFGGIFG